MLFCGRPISLGGITGAGIDKNIKDIYTFLILNYGSAMKFIFLSLSCGAYTARSIGGPRKELRYFKTRVPGFN